MKLVTFLFITLLFIPASYSDIKYNNNDYSEYVIEVFIHSCEGDIVVLESQNEDKRFEIPFTSGNGNLYIRLKKENQAYYYSLGNQNNKEWRQVFPTNRGKNIKNAEEYSDLKVIPLKATSINSSWGRIKYLFTNNQ